MPLPFESVREQLLRAGIAPRHAGRYVTELREHLADLTARQRAEGHNPKDAAERARALLGTDAQLVQEMIARGAPRSLAARAPWAVFGLLPPFAAIVVFLVPCLALVLIARANGIIMRDAIVAPHWFQLFAQVVTWASNFLLGPILAILFIVLAQRHRLNSKWPILGIVIVALFALHLYVIFPTPSHRGGSISIGPLFLASARAWPALMLQWPALLAQFIPTLLPAAWLIFLHHHNSEIRS